VSNTNAGFVSFVARFSSKSARLGLGNVLAALRPWTLSAVVAGLVTFGCGTPAATLEISAPSSAVAGSPFTVTVTAMVGGNRDTIINCAIQFTSSDSAAVLPTYYFFTANDAGSHTFTNGVTLMTAGSQSLTATCIEVPSLTATANVTVSAMTTATRFNVSVPSTGAAGSAFSTKVAVGDANGNEGNRLRRDSSHLSSSDKAATVPADHTSTLADNGRYVGAAASESAFGLP